MVLGLFVVVLAGIVAMAPTAGQVPPVYKLEGADRALVERVVAAEARGEPFEGMVAVAQVILDRLLHPVFPNTVAEVVMREFASPYRGVVTNEVKKAVSLVFDYGQRAFEGTLLYFMNPITASKNGAAWIRRNCNWVLTIGNHKFYNME